MFSGRQHPAGRLPSIPEGGLLWMDLPAEGNGKQSGVRLCMACETFGILPARPAVDPTGSSTDEADRLCRTHRERVLRGNCFMCGGAAVWASPFSDLSIGCCRACVFKHHGLNAARRIETELQNEREGEAGTNEDHSCWN